MKVLRAVVHGRVQGVGFRFFVIREAASRGITGYVRNLNSGDAVEVVACGIAPSLEGLIARLNSGPPGAHVTNVVTQEMDATESYTEFSIRY